MRDRSGGLKIASEIYDLDADGLYDLDGELLFMITVPNVVCPYCVLNSYYPRRSERGERKLRVRRCKHPKNGYLGKHVWPVGALIRALSLAPCEPEHCPFARADTDTDTD